MAYNINLANGSLLVTIEEGVADNTTTSLTLVGKNYSGYGESINENFVRLLENFAKTTAPAGPLSGQIWYDSENQQLKLWNGLEWTLAGSGIQLEQQSSTLHYHAFVEREYGAPPFRTAKNKGLVFQPSSGNFAINKSSIPASRLEINGGTLSRGLPAPISLSSVGETVLHIHGADGMSSRTVIDSFSGSSNAAVNSVLHVRRSRGPSNTPAALGSSDEIGGIAANGHDGSTYSAVSGAIMFVADAAWTASSHPTRIDVMLAANNTTVATKKFSFLHNGDFTAQGDVVAYNTSDITLKTDIEPISDAFAKLSNLDGILFNWNQSAAGKDTEQREVGVIAQQVQAIMPEAVRVKENGTLGVAYDKLIPLLIEAVKELGQEVSRLKNKI